MSATASQKWCWIAVMGSPMFPEHTQFVLRQSKNTFGLCSSTTVLLRAFRQNFMASNGFHSPESSLESSLNVMKLSPRSPLEQRKQLVMRPKALKIKRNKVSEQQ